MHLRSLLAQVFPALFEDDAIYEATTPWVEITPGERCRPISKACWCDGG